MLYLVNVSANKSSNYYTDDVNYDAVHFLLLCNENCLLINGSVETT